MCLISSDVTALSRQTLSRIFQHAHAAALTNHPAKRPHPYLITSRGEMASFGTVQGRCNIVGRTSRPQTGNRALVSASYRLPIAPAYQHSVNKVAQGSSGWLAGECAAKIVLYMFIVDPVKTNCGLEKMHIDDDVV